MKTLLVLLVAILLVLNPISVRADSPTPVASTWLLVDVASGRELAGQEASARIYPASTTKILTALVVMEYADPAELVTVGAEIKLVGRDSSLARLAEGDTLTVQDLLMALMLPSGNDAAYTAAVFTGRKAMSNPQLSVEQAVTTFVGLMNQTALNLGAENSNFVNPDGYHHPEHYCTARDMAKISLAALKHPLIRRVAATYEYTTLVTTPGGKSAKNWRNTNQLLWHTSPYYHADAIGLKSGTTSQAGFCAVSVAKRDDREVLALVFASSRVGRWQDSKLLLEYYFSEYQLRPLVVEDKPITSWGPLEIAPGLSPVGLLSQAEHERLELWFIPDPLLIGRDGPRAPVAKGQIVGELQWLLDGQVVVKVSAVAVNGLTAKTNPAYFIISGAVILVLVLFALINSNAPRRRTVRSRYE